ncbi:MAG: glycosyltransferase [Candidatus Sumerlaeia bacterium]|nr:glycosyltransferase [Candidatus Sumerlaeia bacterium]
MTPWVVMRCYNDAWVVGDTLAGLSRQRMAHRLLVFDNESSDGSKEIIARSGARIVNVPKGAYVPGRVLNQAMRETDGEVVVFVNSDCVPQDDHWLEELVAPFAADPALAAVFGRQVPRPECWPLFAKDTEDTFGDGSRQRFWRHCFSMASSAVRRAAWEEMPFREDIQYSEDVDWTWRQRQAGRTIRYTPKSVAMHSHNYTLRQFHKRQFGEGKAEARIFDWTPWERSLPRYSLLPFARQVVADWRWALHHGRFGALGHSPLLRGAQMLGRRKGFNAGWRERGAT